MRGRLMMMARRWIPGCVGMMVVLVGVAGVVGSARASEAALPALPAIEIDREAGHVELEAEVVSEEADWLELLVCSPNTREYESVLSSPARPSHIHLALLLLDLEPGRPLSWQRVEGEASDEAGDGVAGVEFVVEPPHGPQVAIECIWEDEAGQRHTVPANEWVVHQETGEPLAENVWLFTGSVFRRFEGRPGENGEPRQVYMADLNGTIVSLVNFGDDLLARQTTTTNRNDEQAWSTRSERIPPEGTAVTLRLTPTGERSEGDDPPADDEAAEEAEVVPDGLFVPPATGEAGDGSAND